MQPAGIYAGIYEVRGGRPQSGTKTEERCALAHSRSDRLDRMSVQALMIARPMSYVALRPDACSSVGEVKHAAEWLSSEAEARGSHGKRMLLVMQSARTSSPPSAY